MNKCRIDKEINEYSKRFNLNAAQSRYIIVSSIINSWNSIKIETLTNGFKFTGTFPMDPNTVLSSKRVRQSEEDLPVKSQNIKKFSNQLLSSDSNQIQINVKKLQNSTFKCKPNA